MGDHAFFDRFSGETMRACSGFPSLKTDDVARQVLELHQRHGQAIGGVLEAAVASYKAELVRGSLPPSSILMIAIARGATPAISRLPKYADPVQKLIQEEDGVLPISIEGRNVIAQRGPVTLFIRLIEGEFPDYRQVIPTKNDQLAILPKAQLVGAIRRVSLLSQEHNRGVKLTFNSGQLELLCSNPDLGEAREEVECQYKGKHLEVGFNYRYFLDVLSVLEDETVKLELKDEVSPCVIRSEVDKGFLSLIMPMRL